MVKNMRGCKVYCTIGTTIQVHFCSRCCDAQKWCFHSSQSLSLPGLQIALYTTVSVCYVLCTSTVCSRPSRGWDDSQFWKIYFTDCSVINNCFSSLLQLRQVSEREWREGGDKQNEMVENELGERNEWWKRKWCALNRGWSYCWFDSGQTSAEHPSSWNPTPASYPLRTLPNPTPYLFSPLLLFPRTYSAHN